MEVCVFSIFMINFTQIALIFHQTRSYRQFIFTQLESSFTCYKNITLQNLHTIVRSITIYYHTSLQDLKVCGDSITHTAQCYRIKDYGVEVSCRFYEHWWVGYNADIAGPHRDTAPPNKTASFFLGQQIDWTFKFTVSCLLLWT